jgi:Leucine-rich repeat (LRR) protein
MKIRSHKFPDGDQYTNTIYHDKEENYLDLGYQLFKSLPVFQASWKNITKLLIDHNQLTDLPPDLTFLEELNCSHNRLTQIPFYPQLIFLNLAHNRVKNLSAYHYSRLQYLDCSSNVHIHLDFYLPYCTQLYVMDCQLSEFHFLQYPKLEILDIEKNNLSQLSGADTIIEINAQHNQIKKLGIFHKLKNLMIDYNQLTWLETYPELVYLTISFNHLTYISYQPLLERLIAHNNQLVKLASYPKITYLDISYNNIDLLDIPETCHYLFMYRNPIKSLPLKNFDSLKQMQIGYELYLQLYPQHRTLFKHVSINPCGEQLEELIENLTSFSSDALKLLHRKLFKVPYYKRNEILSKITNKLCAKSLPKGSKVDAKEFQKLYQIINKMYEDSLLVTLYFHDSL